MVIVVVFAVVAVFHTSTLSAALVADPLNRPIASGGSVRCVNERFGPVGETLEVNHYPSAALGAAAAASVAVRGQLYMDNCSVFSGVNVTDLSSKSYININTRQDPYRNATGDGINDDIINVTITNSNVRALIIALYGATSAPLGTNNDTTGGSLQTYRNRRTVLTIEHSTLHQFAIEVRDRVMPNIFPSLFYYGTSCEAEEGRSLALMSGNCQRRKLLDVDFSVVTIILRNNTFVSGRTWNDIEHLVVLASAQEKSGGVYIYLVENYITYIGDPGIGVAVIDSRVFNWVENLSLYAHRNQIFTRCTGRLTTMPTSFLYFLSSSGGFELRYPNIHISQNNMTLLTDVGVGTMTAAATWLSVAALNAWTSYTWFVSTVSYTPFNVSQTTPQQKSFDRSRVSSFVVRGNTLRADGGLFVGTYLQIAHYTTFTTTYNNVAPALLTTASVAASVFTTLSTNLRLTRPTARVLVKLNTFSRFTGHIFSAVSTTGPGEVALCRNFHNGTFHPGPDAATIGTFPTLINVLGCRSRTRSPTITPSVTVTNTLTVSSSPTPNTHTQTFISPTLSVSETPIPPPPTSTTTTTTSAAPMTTAAAATSSTGPPPPASTDSNTGASTATAASGTTTTNPTPTAATTTGSAGPATTSRTTSTALSAPVSTTTTTRNPSTTTTTVTTANISANTSLFPTAPVSTPTTTNTDSRASLVLTSLASPDPGPAASQQFIAVIGAFTAVFSPFLFDALGGIQVVAVLAAMPCGAPGAGGAGAMRVFLSPLHVGGGHTAAVAGLLVLLAAVVCAYGIVLAVAAAALRSVRRAQQLLKHPQIFALLHALALPGLAFESAQLLYGNERPTAGEQALGALVLIASLASVAAYPAISAYFHHRVAALATTTVACRLDSEALAAAVPRVVSAALVPPMAWSPDVLASPRCVYGSLRVQRGRVLRWLSAHSVARSVLVAVIAAVRPSDADHCSAVLGAVAAVCVGHAAIIAVMRPYRVPALNVAQGCVSALAAALAVVGAAHGPATAGSAVAIPLVVTAFAGVLCAVAAHVLAASLELFPSSSVRKQSLSRVALRGSSFSSHSSTSSGMVDGVQAATPDTAAHNLSKSRVDCELLAMIHQTTDVGNGPDDQGISNFHPGSAPSEAPLSGCAPLKPWGAQCSHNQEMYAAIHGGGGGGSVGAMPLDLSGATARPPSGQPSHLYGMPTGCQDSHGAAGAPEGGDVLSWRDRHALADGFGQESEENGVLSIVSDDHISVQPSSTLAGHTNTHEGKGLAPLIHLPHHNFGPNRDHHCHPPQSNEGAHSEQNDRQPKSLNPLAGIPTTRHQQQAAPPSFQSTHQSLTVSSRQPPFAQAPNRWMIATDYDRDRGSAGGSVAMLSAVAAGGGGGGAGGGGLATMSLMTMMGAPPPLSDDNLSPAGTMMAFDRFTPMPQP